MQNAHIYYELPSANSTHRQHNGIFHEISITRYHSWLFLKNYLTIIYLKLFFWRFSVILKKSLKLPPVWITTYAVCTYHCKLIFCEVAQSKVHLVVHLMILAPRLIYRCIFCFRAQLEHSKVQWAQLKT